MITFSAERVPGSPVTSSTTAVEPLHGDRAAWLVDGEPAGSADPAGSWSAWPAVGATSTHWPAPFVAQHFADAVHAHAARRAHDPVVGEAASGRTEAPSIGAGVASRMLATVDSAEPTCLTMVIKISARVWSTLPSMYGFRDHRTA